jgi:hypothetical protein
MKKHHILLIILLAGIVVFFLNESRNLKGRESVARAELAMLRDALKKSPGAATASTLAGKGSRPAAIDPAKFIADLADILKSGSGAEARKSLEDFSIPHRSRPRNTTSQRPALPPLTSDPKLQPTQSGC